MSNIKIDSMGNICPSSWFEDGGREEVLIFIGQDPMRFRITLEIIAHFDGLVRNAELSIGELTETITRFKETPSWRIM